MADLVEWQGLFVKQDQLDFLTLVIEAGTGARGALKSMRRSLGQLSRWLHDAETPDFEEAWRRAKAMMAVHHVDDVNDLLAETRAEIHELGGEDIKKASALANLARSRAEFKWRTAQKLAPKDWGDRVQVDGVVEHRAIVFLPELAMLPPAPVTARIHNPGLVALPSPDNAEVVDAEIRDA